MLGFNYYIGEGLFVQEWIIYKDETKIEFSFMSNPLLDLVHSPS